MHKLRAEWSGLVADDPGASPFVTWEWQALWWQHYGQGNALRIVTARRDGRLVALVPLQIREQSVLRGWLPLRVLQPVGVGGRHFARLPRPYSGARRARGARCGAGGFHRAEPGRLGRPVPERPARGVALHGGRGACLRASGLAGSAIDVGVDPVSRAARLGRVIYHFQTGLDPAWLQVRPGHVMMGYLVENAIAEGAGEFDMLRGLHAFKTDYASDTRQTDALWAARTARAGVAHAARNFVHGWSRLLRGEARTGREAIGSPAGSVQREAVRALPERLP